MLGGYYLGQLYLGLSGAQAPGTLSLQDSSHSHSVESVTLSQKHQITVGDALHNVSSESIAWLVEHWTIAVQNAIHSVTSESTVLTQKQIIAINNALHTLSSGDTTLTQKHAIQVADAIHTLLSEVPVLIPHFILIMQDAIHTLVSDSFWVLNGIYIKDVSSVGIYNESGEVNSGVVDAKHSSFGQITPVSDENLGFLVVDMGTNGSYT